MYEGLSLENHLNKAISASSVLTSMMKAKDNCSRSPGRIHLWDPEVFKDGDKNKRELSPFG